MVASVTRRPGPRADRESEDVLVSGSERAPWQPPPRLQSAAVAAVILAAALAVPTALVRSQRAEDARALAARAEQQRLVLALRQGPHLVLRDTAGSTDVPAQAHMHVELVNESRRRVQLESASLTPGDWRVDIVDRSLLLPGESVVLSLRHPVDCGAPPVDEPAPEHLVLRAAVADRPPSTVRLDLAGEQAYGGLLDDALRDPRRACAAPAPGPYGPIGDLFRGPARQAGGG